VDDVLRDAGVAGAVDAAPQPAGGAARLIGGDGVAGDGGCEAVDTAAIDLRDVARDRVIADLRAAAMNTGSILRGVADDGVAGDRRRGGAKHRDAATAILAGVLRDRIADDRGRRRAEAQDAAAVARLVETDRVAGDRRRPIDAVDTSAETRRR